MRIRSTKPEFWRSRTVASVDWDARLVLKGLESYVDDNGVGKDDLALIVGDVFPRDMLANTRDTLARVSEALGSLFQAGLIHRYESEGRPLLYISNWESIQRIDKPGKGRLPRPDGTMDFRESVIRESVAKGRESVAPGTGEQGNRGTGEQGIETCASAPPKHDAPTYPAAFEEFWSAYPLRKGKRQALPAWQKAIKRADNATIIAAIPGYEAECKRTDTHMKHPATWLNADGWLDEPAPSMDRQSQALTTRQRKYLEAELLKDNPDPRALQLAQENGYGYRRDHSPAPDRGGLRQPKHRPADGGQLEAGFGDRPLDFAVGGGRGASALRVVE